MKPQAEKDSGIVMFRDVDPRAPDRSLGRGDFIIANFMILLYNVTAIQVMYRVSFKRISLC